MSAQDGITSMWLAGFNAFYAGATELHNPWDRGTLGHASWLRGFYSANARFERIKARVGGDT